MKIWSYGKQKKLMEGVIAWEGCIEVPEGIIDSMNLEVDEWKKDMTMERAKKENRMQGLYGNGPIRFNPETMFHNPDNIAYFQHVQKNTLNKVAQYCELYPDADLEINWVEAWQYITYTPPKNMGYHSDNHSPRNKETGKPFLGPNLRRFTVLTYLNDNFQGGSLVYRYFKDMPPYKAPPGTVLIQPSNYMWSHATTPLLNGRKAAFLVAFNSYYNEEDERKGASPEELKARELR